MESEEDSATDGLVLDWLFEDLTGIFILFECSTNVGYEEFVRVCDDDGLSVIRCQECFLL